MRILLISNYSPDRQESMQRYSTALGTYLSAINNTVDIISPKAIFGSRMKNPYGKEKWLGYIDKFILFPIYLLMIKKKYDQIHICDHGNAMYVPYIQDVPHVVTCHDLFGIKAGLGLNGKNRRAFTARIFQTLILNGLKKARHIVTVSGQTKTELMEISGISDNRISVVYNPLNYPYTPSTRDDISKVLKALDLPPGTRYLFHIGDDKWYKNRLGAIKMFEKVKEKTSNSDLYFILAGKPFETSVADYVAQSPYSGFIKKIDFVTNEQLQHLYSGAIALLFPSFAEGFGWPIIEAQSCGCPVITSNRAPMTEVGNDSVIYVDPENISGAADTISHYLQNEDLQSSSKSKGFENVKRFSESIFTQQILESYSKSRT